MRAYKGFNPDLTCRDFQYAEGETYETDVAVLCETGFHACPLPLDTWQYYPPSESVYHEVEVPDDAVKGGDKVAATSITIKGRLSLPELIGEHIRLVFERAERASDDESTAVTSGDRSTAATSGNWSTAATSGYQSLAATSGYEATAAVTGEDSVAVATGVEGKARGGLGCWLFLTERDYDCRILGAEAVKVDGDTIKPDVAYTLRDGRVVEV